MYLFCVVHQSIFLYIDMHLVPTQLLLASYSAPDLSDCVDIENKGMFLCSGSRYPFSSHYVLVPVISFPAIHKNCLLLSHCLICLGQTFFNS